MTFRSLKRVCLHLGLALFAAASGISWADHHETFTVLNGKDFMGRAITVNVARPREERPKRNFGNRNRGGNNRGDDGGRNRY